MDNTTNTQNPQPVPQAQTPQPIGNAYPDQGMAQGQPVLVQPSQQPVMQPVPTVSQAQPSTQPVQQPMPPSQPIPQPIPQPIMQQTSQEAQNAIYQQTQTSSSSTTEPTASTDNSPKITLDDLYGPSGFANDTSDSLAPVSVPTPLPTEQAPIQAEASSTPANTVAAPESLPLPDLPTMPQENAQGVETKDVPVPADLPLRKTLSQVEEQTPVVPPPPLTTPPSTPGDTGHKSDGTPASSGPNKLKLLRIIFGVLGVLVSLVVILFVVQFLSSVFHPSGSSSKVTLIYWGLWEDSNTMQPIISQFEREHPNITVEYIKQDPKQYSQRLLTRIKQGDGPDIFRYHSSWLPVLQPVLAPLPTSVISKEELQNNFYPVVRNDLVRNGALYGIPMEVDTLSLFVNNTIFQSAKAQVPTTWDSFTTTARALTIKDANGKIKTAGAAFGTYDNITHAPDILSALLVQNGVDLQTMTPSSNAADALTFYTSFATGDSNVWDNTLDPSMLAFARGNLAMYFGYSWDVFMIKASNPNLDFSIYPIPHLPGRNTTAASYWVEGVSAKSQHQKEALEFMQFLAQKSTEATLYTEESKTRLFGEPYARTDLGATLKSNPLVYPFVEQATNATSSFFAGETDDTALNGQMNGYLGNAVRAILNGTSAQSAVDTLTKGVQQVEKQYGF